MYEENDSIRTFTKFWLIFAAVSLLILFTLILIIFSKAKSAENTDKFTMENSLDKIKVETDYFSEQSILCDNVCFQTTDYNLENTAQNSNC
jgi:hypothetical protein